MVVFSNRWLGPVVELLVSHDVAAAMLASTAAAALPLAQGRWELELVRWLEDRTRELGDDLDVADIAWTPEHFERQRDFVVAAVQRAAVGSEHSRALGLWTRMIADHPRDAVSVGHRWLWATTDARI